MKKIIKSLSVVMIFLFSINVFAESNDATLKNIKINGNNIVCSENVCSYEIKDNNVNTATITYEVNDEKATVSKESITLELKVGDNKESVVVTAEDGTEITYNFVINKTQVSTDSSLATLKINGTSVNLKADTFKYSTTVSFAATKIEIEATTTDSGAKIEYPDGKKSIDFFENSKDIKLVVKSAAGDMTTYTITVTKRAEQDATLKNITLDCADLEFKSDKFDYEVSVFRNVDTVDIKAVATDSKAKVDIKKNNYLEIGENKVTITVTNDGNTKTYNIKITRLEQEDKTISNLKSLTIKGYTLDFDPEVYDYKLKISDENILNIKAVPVNDKSDVEITGNYNIVDGQYIKIRVNYSDTNYKIYKILIEKDEVAIKKSSNSKLAIILVLVFIILAAITIFVIQKIRGKKKKEEVKKDNNIKEVESKKTNKITLVDDDDII